MPSFSITSGYLFLSRLLILTVCRSDLCLAVGYGGFNVDLDSDNSHPKFMSLSDAKQLCTANGHAGFTYQPSRVWWLKAITDTSGFHDGGGQFDVYQLYSCANRLYSEAYGGNFTG